MSSKSKKQTFYCSVCNITLNSEATLKIHCQGHRHAKKSISSGARDGGVIRIPNPEPRKKIPVKLAQKITDSSSVQHVVGLDFIMEYVPVSDDEMEPHYQCELCESKGQSNCMFSHLTGRIHRRNFALTIYPEKDVLDATPAKLARIAEMNDERKVGFERRIRTIRSDEEYPWPSGKAPWLVENGGDGVVPPLADRKFDVKPPGAPATASERKENFHSDDWRQFKPNQVKPPASREEAVKMMVLAQRMMELGLESRGASTTDVTSAKIFTGLALNSLL